MRSRLSTGQAPVRVWSALRPLSIFVLSLAFVAPPALGQSDRQRESFDVAIGLLRRELHDEAAKQFRRFLRSSPNHALAGEAWYRLGCCEEANKNDDESVAAFKKALAKRHRFMAECRYRLGKLLQKDKKLEPAVEQFVQLLRENGKTHYLHAAASYACGECLRDLDQKEGALAAFDTAAGSAKKADFGMPALYQAGFMLLALDRPAEAAQRFGKAASKWSEHEAASECRHLEGEAQYRAKNYEAASRAYSEVAKSGGTFAPDARFGLAWCHVQQDDSKGALREFRRVLSRHPKHELAKKAALEAGRLEHAAGRFGAARDLLGTLVSRRDLDDALRVEALELYALAQLDDDKADEAAKLLTRALRLEAGHAEAGKGAVVPRTRLQYLLGESLSDLERWEDAAKAYDAAAKSKDDAMRGDALYGATVARHRAGDHERSIESATRLLSELSEHPLAVQARYALAENHYALGHYKNADEAYAQIPGEHELASEAAFKRAWCSYLAKDRKAAAQRFARIAARKGKRAEESLSMAALSHWQANDLGEALRAADLYSARYRGGTWTARCERVAAQVYLARNDLEAAEKRVARAATAEKSKEEAAGDMLQLADVAFRRDNFDKAKAIYGPLAQAEGSLGARAQRGLAWCAFELRDDDEAIRWIEIVTKNKDAKDKWPEMVELLSSLHHRAKRWPQAIQAGKRYVQSFPQSPRVRELRFALGVALARNNDLAAARRELEGLLGEELQRPDLLQYELAWVYRRAKDEDKAIAAFRKTLDISKDKELIGEAKLHVGLAALEGGNKEEADRLLGEVEGRYRAQALYRRAFAKFEKESFGDALGDFERVVAIGEAAGKLRHEALFFAGTCEYRREKWSEAATRFRKLLAQAPSHDRARLAKLQLGECEVRLDRAQAAIALLEDWLSGAKSEAPTEQARGWLWLGRARHARRQYGSAEKAFLRVTKLSLGPLGAEAQFRIGEARRADEKLEAAIDAFLKLSFLYGHEEWIQRGLLEAGRCYQQLDEKKKARKFLAELVQRFPKSDAAKEARRLLEQLKGD